MTNDEMERDDQPWEMADAVRSPEAMRHVKRGLLAALLRDRGKSEWQRLNARIDRELARQRELFAAQKAAGR